MKTTTKPVVDVEDTTNPINWQLISQLLPKQTVRWCQITSTLWSIIALDTQRNLDPQSVSQFVEVIYWRAHGKITDEEFSVLFVEWMKPQQTGSTAGSNKKKNNNFINVMLLRNFIFEKKYTEADLDLFIGIIVNETNSRLLNSTISYTNKVAIPAAHTIKTSTNPTIPRVSFNALPSYSLEVVTNKWLELSEELFFLFDTPGYGSLKYDELYFFVTGVIVGLQNWKTELELENSLQLIHTSSMTLQVMKDMGVNIQPFLTPGRASLPVITSSSVQSLSNNSTRKTTHRGQHSLQKFEVSLIMFKKFLLKTHLGESELQYLIQFFQDSIERIHKLSKLSNAEELYVACSPVENLGHVIGSPRLWQHAVLIAAGFTTNSTLTGTQRPTPNIPSQFPPILSFLLSDGDLHISALFRAIEFPVEGIGFSQDGFSVAIDAAHTLADYNNPLLSTIAANEELHDNALRIFAQFRRWGQQPTNSHGGFSSFHSPDGVADYQRDPIYQLILSSLLQYKRLQHFLSAAFFDFAVSQFGLSPQSLSLAEPKTSPNATNQYNHSLAILCHGLMPNNQEVLSEFGLIDNLLLGGDGENDNMTTMSYGSQAKSTTNATIMSGNTIVSHSTNSHRYNVNAKPPAVSGAAVSATAKRMLLDELNQELQYDDDNNNKVDNPHDFLEDEDFEQEEKAKVAAVPGRVADKMSVGTNKSSSASVSNSVTSTVSRTQSTSSASGTLKISNLPIAEKRKTDLLQLTQSKPSNNDRSNKESKGTKAIQKVNPSNPSNNVPNYFKPTATSSARLVGGAKGAAESEILPPHPPNSDPNPANSHKQSKSLSQNSTRKISPGVIPVGSTAISPVAPLGDSDLQFGSDSEYSQLDQIQWKSLLDTPFSGAAHSSTRSFPKNNPAEDTSRGGRLARDPLPEKETISPVKLTNDESRLFAQLLISSNTQEQQQLIEALRKKLNNFSLRESSNNDWDNPSGGNKEPLSSASLGRSEAGGNDDSSFISPQHDLFDLQPPLPPPPSQSVPPASSHLNEANPSETSSTTNISAPSSILELLQQGHNPGKYAQMLREILRKMSKDDANVRLRSLEQVLLLGQNIVHHDTEEKRKKLMNAGVLPGGSPGNVSVSNVSPSKQVIAVSSPPSNNRGPQRSQSNPKGSKRSPVNNNSTPPFATNTSRSSPSYYTAEDLPRQPKVISRTTLVPGLMPDEAGEKKPKKAFGHYL